MKLRHLPALLMFLAVPAWAQMAMPTLTKDPAQIPAGTYSVEPRHTRVLFSVTHFGFSTYYGDFVNPTGTLDLKPQNLAASTLEITIPVDSVSTTNSVLDGELKAADWLDATKFPTMTFKSTSIKSTGPDTAQITGDFTMHGVTKPVTLTAKLNGGGPNPFNKKYTVGFEVSGMLKRSEFGVSKFAPLVSDDVQLIISAAFEKQG